MRILATTDGSEFSLEALRRVGGMLPATGSEVTLVSVFPSPAAGLGTVGMMGPPYLDYTALSGQLEEVARGFVAQGEQILKDQGFSVRPLVLEGDAATRILELAESEPYDLIVVGSHGRTGFAKFFLGSVSARIVSHAPCSVLVIKHVK